MCDNQVGTLCPAHLLALLLTSALGLCLHMEVVVWDPGFLPMGGHAWLWAPLVTVMPFQWHAVPRGGLPPAPSCGHALCSLVSARHRFVKWKLPISFGGCESNGMFCQQASSREL